MKYEAIALSLAALVFAPAAPGVSAEAAAPRVHRVEMAQMRFGPMPVGIKAGDVILWVNRDLVPHTATARNGSFDVVLPARQSRRMLVQRSGTIAFYCRYHPGMRGALTVAVR